MINIAINGFGRIGRCVARALVEESFGDSLKLVAINGPASNETHAHLLQYDSVHGRFRNVVTHDEAGINFGLGPIPVLHERDASKLNWKQYGVDVVLECTGALTSREAASVHLQRGAKHVLLSAPASDDCNTVVYGVNHATITKDDRVISIGSCTTNALAPVAQVLHETFGIDAGFMTTIHAYTGDQNIVDGSHKDLRRARAAGLSMIPTKTGAAKAIGLVLPALAGKLQGVAVRVPTANVSMVDLVVNTAKPVTKEAVNAAMRAASDCGLKGVLAYSDGPLVSIDFNHHPASSIFDATATHVVGENMLRIAAWYDNEWGFSCRMLDVAKLVGS
jgi:glyceraldehyde 3-phosphate dehydrogenase